MGLQCIISGISEASSLQPLLAAYDNIEVFPIDENSVGISVPSKEVDNIGEPELRGLLSAYRYYDLWSGKWHEPVLEPRGLFSRLVRWR